MSSICYIRTWRYDDPFARRAAPINQLINVLPIRKDIGIKGIDPTWCIAARTAIHDRKRHDFGFCLRDGLFESKRRKRVGDLGKKGQRCSLVGFAVLHLADGDAGEAPPVEGDRAVRIEGQHGW